VIPIHGANDEGALWIPETVVTNGSVPARIYDNAGDVVLDITGNWWTEIFSGATDTAVLCAKAWYTT
jgi:hypothetical protein